MNDLDVVIWLLDEAEKLGAKHPIMNRMTVTGEVVITDTGLYGTGNTYRISITKKDEFCCDARRRSFAGMYIGAQGVRVCEGCGKPVK